METYYIALVTETEIFKTCNNTVVLLTNSKTHLNRISPGNNGDGQY